MRRSLSLAVMLALSFAILPGTVFVMRGPAFAWLIYPDRDRVDRLVVEIEKPYGDLVVLQALPPPYNRAVQTAQGPDTLSFRWRYDRDAEGLAFLRVGEDGTGTMEFRFAARKLVEGRRLGAAAVLVSRDGTPLHSFLARGKLAVGASETVTTDTVQMTARRPPGWWNDVSAIAFFYMSYDPLQKLDDEGVWRAMRNAVAHFTKGKGTEQRG